MERGQQTPPLEGYAAVAAWIALDPDSETFVFRKFDRLAARNLLYLQSELLAVEKDLDRLDRPPIVLEGSAAEIWQRIDGVRAHGAIVAELVDFYGEEPDVIAPAVAAFLSDLAEQNLIEKVSDV